MRQRRQVGLVSRVRGQLRPSPKRPLLSAISFLFHVDVAQPKLNLPKFGRKRTVGLGTTAAWTRCGSAGSTSPTRPSQACCSIVAPTRRMRRRHRVDFAGLTYAAAASRSGPRRSRRRQHLVSGCAAGRRATGASARAARCIVPLLPVRACRACQVCVRILPATTAIQSLLSYGVRSAALPVVGIARPRRGRGSDGGGLRAASYRRAPRPGGRR